MYTQTNINNSLFHLSSSLTTSLCVQTPAPSHHWPSLLASGFNLELERLLALINGHNFNLNHPLSNLGGQLPSDVTDLTENARTSCRRSAQFTLSYENRFMISDSKIARLYFAYRFNWSAWLITSYDQHIVTTIKALPEHWRLLHSVHQTVHQASDLRLDRHWLEARWKYIDDVKFAFELKILRAGQYSDDSLGGEELPFWHCK